MSWYREQLLPRFIDRLCGARELRRWREKAVEGLSGCVVEIGFGSGLNVDYYPPEVESVWAVEPAALAKQLAMKRIERSRVPIVHVGLDGQAIPLEDASCDTALATFTLCTVPDPRVVLAEVYRVLRPGGTFHFLEHGLSPNYSVALWQRRLDPLQGYVGGGCHLTRDPLALVNNAGFHLVWSEQGYAHGPKPWTYLSVGVVAKPR